MNSGVWVEVQCSTDISSACSPSSSRSLTSTKPRASRTLRITMAGEISIITQAQFMESVHKRQRDELSEDSDIIDEINKDKFLQGMGPRPTKRKHDEPNPAIDLLRYVTILSGQQNSELSSSAIHNQSQSPFFSLPGEVRNRIYKYLTPNAHVHAAPSTQRLHVTFCAQTTESGEYGKQAQERLAAARLEQLWLHTQRQRLGCRDIQGRVVLRAR